MQAKDTLHFGFEELSDAWHFAKDTALDEMIRMRFEPTLEAVARCELFTWRTTAEGAWAEIIVLDQSSRNIFSGHASRFCAGRVGASFGVNAGCIWARSAFKHRPAPFCLTYTVSRC